MKKKTALLIFLCIIFWLTIILSLVRHEETHKAIAYEHGCINGSIHYNIKVSFFSCEKYLIRSEETKLQESMLHSLNEIVSYNMEALLFLIFGVGVVMIYLVGDY